MNGISYYKSRSRWVHTDGGEMNVLGHFRDALYRYSKFVTETAPKLERMINDFLEEDRKIRDKYSFKSLTENNMFDEEATPEVAPEAPVDGFPEQTLEENNVA